MEETTERRQSFRMPFNAEVVCHTSDRNYKGKIRDLSSNGFFMKAGEYPPAEALCDVEIFINGNHSRLRIDKLKGRVVRFADNGVGIGFDDRLEWVALIPIYFHKLQEQAQR